ncbi:hypothetical protein CCMSSC00406_0008503 [Pleurotus cornucopiae]|uniref:Uncharacterized protein n=1 Tax=Pleurotus cornucopiae TaxID=5321 RepID=A0ACB7II59_PLECO|nr:hypothetical protein CCMSSC00406_0008503 [Pleurotus cornucopiae]
MLSRIRLHALFMAQRFDPDNTITGMCNELNELIPLVRWTARSIKQIVKNFPLMSRSSFISRAQQSAFEWTTRLKGLVSDVEESKPYQEPSRAAEWTTCQWSSLYQHLQTCVRGPRAEMTQFLCIIAASHFYRSFDIENARLGEFITKLSLTRGLRNPRVDTIWVREPTGMEWFCIPLRFCETWEGFSTVIYEYCKNGPEIEYICGGNWAIIRDTDNHIIDQMQFTSVLTPEMRFDIGVIIRLASLLAGTCLQCGHQNDGSNSVDGWVSCSNIECANLFRVVFQPNDKSTEPVASKSTHSRMLSSNKKRAKIPSRGRISSRTRMQHLSTKFHRMLANIPYSPLEGGQAKKMQDDPLSSENDNGTSKTHEPLVNVEEIPQWLSMAMQAMQAEYLNDNMEAVFRNIKGSTTPEWRIKCADSFIHSGLARHCPTTRSTSEIDYIGGALRNALMVAPYRSRPRICSHSRHCVPPPYHVVSLNSISFDIEYRRIDVPPRTVPNPEVPGPEVGPPD